MTVATYQIPGGARVMIYRCDKCGEYASRGTGVNIRAALATGDVKRAGQWLCYQCWKDGK